MLGHDVVADYRMARRRSAWCRRSWFSIRFSPSVRRCASRPATSVFAANDAWIDEILHNLDLDGEADANMRALSGGMKRRVLVGQALVHKPPVIVLDEPTAGVDVELRQSLWAFIRQLNRDGHTIILTTHYLEEAEALCGRIAMLKAGRVVALDNTQTLLSSFAGLTVRLTGRRAAGSAGPIACNGAKRRTVSSDAGRLRRARAPARRATRARHRHRPSWRCRRPTSKQVFLRIMKRAA